MLNTTDYIARLNAKAQVSLAFFYGLMFIGIFVGIVIFWDKLSKLDASVLSMLATNAMNQSKDAGAYFFARHRPPSGTTNSDGETPSPTAPVSQPAPLGVTSQESAR